MAKKNPYVFTINLDESDMIQKKVAAILEKSSRHKKLSQYVTTALVLATQMKCTPEELMEMQLDFLQDPDPDLAIYKEDAHPGSNGKKKPKRKSSSRRKKEIPSADEESNQNPEQEVIVIKGNDSIRSDAQSSAPQTPSQGEAMKIDPITDEESSFSIEDTGDGVEIDPKEIEIDDMFAAGMEQFWSK